MMEKIDAKRNEKKIVQSIVSKERSKKEDAGSGILDMYICVCNDGGMGLFKKRRVFDIIYSMWVEVYEGLDSDRLAILDKSGDKVFPAEKWLGQDGYIETRNREIIRPNCTITNVIRCAEIIASMKEHGAIFHFQKGKMSSREIDQILNYAYRQFKFENPKQKIKAKITK